MEFVESLLKSSRQQRSFSVYLTADHSCWVALPKSLAAELHETSRLDLPVVLCITDVSSKQRCHAAWAGAASDSQNLEVPDGLAECLSLKSGQQVEIGILSGVPVADTVAVDPDSPDDWELVELNAACLEDRILQQVGLVEEGVRFPFWLRKGTSVQLRCSSVTPGPLAKLTIGSELVVAPRLRKAMLPGASACQPASVKTGTWWLRVQEPPAILEHHAVSWPIRDDPEGCRHGETSVTAFVLLPEDLFETGCACAGQQLTIGTSYLSADSDCITLFAVPSPFVARCHIALSSALRQLLGLRLGQRVCINLSRDDHFQARSADVDVEVQLCPLDLSCGEVSSVSSPQTEHCRLVDSVEPFLRQWWATQLAILDAHPTMNDYPISYDSVPAGVVAKILIDGGGQFFFRVSLSVSTSRSCVAGGFSNGALASAKHSRPSESALRGTFGKIVHWSIARPSTAVFELPDACNLAFSSWLADAQGSLLDRFNSLLVRNGRGLIDETGLPRSGGTLVSGPSGSGKTTLLSGLPKHLSSELKVPIRGVYVSCGHMVGASQTAARQELSSAVQAARDQAPAVLLLDDIDALFPAAEDDSSNAVPASAADPSGGLAAWFARLILNGTSPACWRGRKKLGQWPVAVVASCSVSSNVSVSLRGPGRLDFDVNLSPPGPGGQQCLVESALKEQNVDDPNGLLQQELQNLDGCDAFDLRVLVDRTRLAAARRRLAGSLDRPPRFFRTESQDGTMHRLMVHSSDVSLACRRFVASALRQVANPVPASSEEVLGWQDVGGAHAAVAAIRDVLELARLASGWDQAAPLRLRTGLLLYGPPGCGKTHLVRCAASAAGMRLISVKGPELLNKYIGQSEAGVRRIFSKASAAAPCILFFDEFDSLAPKRGHDNTGVTDRVVNALLAELDGVQGLRGVVVLAATSRPDLVDAALLRPGRLDRSVECDMPTANDRGAIARALSRRLPLACYKDAESVAAATDGLSGADISAALADAHLIAVHEQLEACSESQEKHQPGGMRISHKHLQTAFQSIRPSLSSHEKERLNRLYHQFRGFRSCSSSDAPERARVTLA